MSSDIAIQVSNVSKYYQIYDKPIDRLKQSLFRGRKKFYKEFKAVDNISFEIKKGETVGIIGRNGSGKSTLLQMICGTLTPTSGDIRLTGRVAALLELGAGFNPEFTGRENVYLNASILGLNQQEIDEKYDDIKNFSGIGDFIEQPVKTYSSGMYVRLAFSVAINVEPDILIVDEALSVGDMNFQAKCMTAITRIQENGATVLFVSHDVGAVKSLCTRGIYLDAGLIRMVGESSEVTEVYIRDMREEANLEIVGTAESTNGASNNGSSKLTKYKNTTSLIFKKSVAFDSRVAMFRYGAGGVTTTYAELLDTDGNELKSAVFNQKVNVRIHFESTIDSLIGVCYYVMDDKKNLIIGAGPRQLDEPYMEVKPGSKYIVTYATNFPLQEGDYSIQIQLNSPLQEGLSAEYLDVIDDAVVFKMSRKDPVRIWTKVFVNNEMDIIGL